MADAPTFHCAECGAPARPGDFSCRYCGAGIATLRCARCFHMNMAQAQHCSGCGAELGLIVESVLQAAQCSDCGHPLEVVREPAGSLLACRRCGGQFVEHPLFRSMIEHAETAGLAIPNAPYQRPVPRAVLERVHYRPCAVCQQRMNRKNFGGASGVIVDVCAKHGTWFDAGELPQIMAFIQSGGLVRERVQELERQRLAHTREREQRSDEAGPVSPDTLHLEALPHGSFATDVLSFLREVLRFHERKVP